MKAWVRFLTCNMAAFLVLVTSSCTGVGVASPSPARQATPTGRATPAFNATPTQSVATTRPTLPPGVADISGTIYDGQGATIQGVRVQLDPMNLVAFTDAAGFFEIPNIPVPGRCRWATVTISKDGFGTSRRVDEPIYQGFSRGQVVLRAQPDEEYVGPPLAEAYMGESYCTR
jgi:carboxypeptidase family protein